MNRNTAIMVTGVFSLLCGCPALSLIFTGTLSILLSFIPGTDISVLGRTGSPSASNFGIITLCIGVILIIVPVVVGFVTLRGKFMKSDPDAQNVEQQA